MHFEQGQDYRRAVRYHQQAAKTALQRAAHQEAIDHLTQGLALLATWPDTPERAQHELTLQATLAVPLIITKGYAAPELEAVYARARERCRRVEDTPQRFRVLLGLLRFYVVRGLLAAAREIGEQMLTLARQGQDPTLLLLAHYAMGGVFFHLGELASARRHLEQGLALYDPQQHGSLTVQTGDDPGVVGRNFIQYILWLLGYPDQALEKNAEALTLAEQDHSAEGVTHIHQGLAAHRATGAEYRLPYHLALLAEV